MANIVKLKKQHNIRMCLLSKSILWIKTKTSSRGKHRFQGITKGHHPLSGVSAICCGKCWAQYINISSSFSESSKDRVYTFKRFVYFRSDFRACQYHFAGHEYQENDFRFYHTIYQTRKQFGLVTKGRHNTDHNCPHEQNSSSLIKPQCATMTSN